MRGSVPIHLVSWDLLVFLDLLEDKEVKET